MTNATITPATTITTRKVLFVENGENWGTIAPVCEVVVEGDEARDVLTGKVYNLAETCWRCVSFDNDMQVEINKYRVNDVNLPEFLSVKAWIHDDVSWKYAWGMGMDASWPEAWQRALLRLGTEFIYNVAPLLNTYRKGTFRSNFRRSLAEAVVLWLETAPEDRKYDRPLSSRQFDAIARPSYEHERVASGLYRNRHIFGVTV